MILIATRNDKFIQPISSMGFWPRFWKEGSPKEEPGRDQSEEARGKAYGKGGFDSLGSFRP